MMSTGYLSVYSRWLITNCLCPTKKVTISSEVMNADSGPGPCLQGFCGRADEGHGPGQSLGRCLWCSRMPLCPVWAVDILVTALVLLGWTFHFQQHSSWPCPRCHVASEILQPFMKFYKLALVRT